jgi:hypothetical protein
MRYPVKEGPFMFGDSGGWLWLLIDVAFVALLAAGLIYGMVMWRSRRKSADVARESATRRLYREQAKREDHGA